MVDNLSSGFPESEIIHKPCGEVLELERDGDGYGVHWVNAICKKCGVSSTNIY